MFLLLFSYALNIKGCKRNLDIELIAFYPNVGSVGY